MEFKTGHPEADPKLPSYVHPTLKDLRDDIQRAWDCWQYLRSAKASYLPKEPEEPNEAYQARLDRAVYCGFFRDSIESFTGILSRFQRAGQDPRGAGAPAAADRTAQAAAVRG